MSFYPHSFLYLNIIDFVTHYSLSLSTSSLLATRERELELVSLESRLAS